MPHTRSLPWRHGLLTAITLSAATAAHADGIFDSWLNAVTATQNNQPHWVTPLVTVTPRLEQEYRADFLYQRMPDGSATQNYGNGKGLELIVPNLNTEVLINAPAYIHRSSAKPDGFADPSIALKYRVAAANEENGNYIITLMASEGFAMSSRGVDTPAKVYTPTLLVGKGFGRFDIQSTYGYSIPDSDTAGVGRTRNWSTALQYHVGTRLWPEVEYQRLSYSGGGANRGHSQDFVTAGLISKWHLQGRMNLVAGLGYQQAVGGFRTYDNQFMLTTRLSF